MKNYTLFLLLLLGSCATPTPKKSLPEGTKVVPIVYMKPDKAICQYRRTIVALDRMWGDENKVWDDINHLAAESRANVGHLVRLWGQIRQSHVELFQCPENYVQNYLKKNFKR